MSSTPNFLGMGSNAAADESGSPTAQRQNVCDAPTPSVQTLYSLHDEIGRGHYGVVRSCEHRITREFLACKSISKKDMGSRRNKVHAVRQEIAAMRSLSGHPNVVQLRGVFEDSEHVHLVMENCTGGELYTEVKRRRFFSEAEAAQVFKQLAAALASCHAIGVMHGDLKPENVLLSSPCSSGVPTVKLADFGLSLSLKPGQTVEGMAGSPYYMAPEVLTRKYDHTADLWSLGVILYILLCGFPPFWGPSEAAVFESIKHGKPQFQELAWKSVSLDAKGIIWQLLTADPEKRPSAASLLKHPWVRRHSPLEPRPTAKSSPAHRHAGSAARIQCGESAKGASWGLTAIRTVGARLKVNWDKHGAKKLDHVSSQHSTRSDREVVPTRPSLRAQCGG